MKLDNPRALYDLARDFRRDRKAREKDPFETTEEYQKRLAALPPPPGGTFTLPIPPEECGVFPRPDEGLYIVHAAVVLRPFPAPWDIIRVFGADLPPSESRRPEIFDDGRKMPNDRYLDLQPKNLSWDLKFVESAETPDVIYFGLPVRTTDLAFRDLLRQKKIGLAVRVRLASDTDAGANTASTTRAGRFRPSLSGRPDSSVLVELTDAWVVDTTTGKSVVHWPAGQP